MTFLAEALPRGVEEAVPRDAVSRRRWRNEPESRRAPPVGLPLEPVVAAFQSEQQVQKKIHRGVIEPAYHLFKISNIITQLKQNHAQENACLLWAEVF